jgi:hypothetical protein
MLLFMCVTFVSVLCIVGCVWFVSIVQDKNIHLPRQPFLLRATAVKNTCDGHRGYLRHSSHETCTDNTTMRHANTESG